MHGLAIFSCLPLVLAASITIRQQDGAAALPQSSSSSSSSLRRRRLDPSPKFSKRRRHEYYHGEYGEGKAGFVHYCHLELKDMYKQDGILSSKDFAYFVHDFCQHSARKGDRCDTTNKDGFISLPLDLQLLFVESVCHHDDKALECLANMDHKKEPVSYPGDIHTLCDRSFEFMTPLLENDPEIITIDANTDAQPPATTTTTTTIIESDQAPKPGPNGKDESATSATTTTLKAHKDSTTASSSSSNANNNNRSKAGTGIAVGLLLQLSLFVAFVQRRRRHSGGAQQVLELHSTNDDKNIGMPGSGSNRGWKLPQGSNKAPGQGELLRPPFNIRLALPQRGSSSTRESSDCSRTAPDLLSVSDGSSARTEEGAWDNTNNKNKNKTSSPRDSILRLIGRQPHHHHAPVDVQSPEGRTLEQPELTRHTNKQDDDSVAETEGSLATFKFVSEEVKEKFKEFDSRLTKGFQELQKEMHSESQLESDDADYYYENDDDSSVDSHALRNSMQTAELEAMSIFNERAALAPPSAILLVEAAQNESLLDRMTPPPTTTTTTTTTTPSASSLQMALQLASWDEEASSDDVILSIKRKNGQSALQRQKRDKKKKKRKNIASSPKKDSTKRNFNELMQMFDDSCDSGRGTSS